MTDSLAPRGKFAVLAPSTNTSVQPEFDAMRPWGVTNHHSRLIIPDTRVTDDRSFMTMMDTIRGADSALKGVQEAFDKARKQFDKKTFDKE